MGCEIFCSSSVKNDIGNLIGIALNLLEKALAPSGGLPSMGLHRVGHN